MIDFMIISLPRSGSAWLANLFTTDDSLCLHEALIDKTIMQMDIEKHFYKFGIAETSACFIEEAVTHPCKKLIVDRPLQEINKSLADLGLPSMPEHNLSCLANINGYRIAFKDIFNYQEMSKAYSFLLDKPLSKQRHEMLCKMDIQNQHAINYVKELF